MSAPDTPELPDTPERHHDRLMDEIEYELDTYGLSSLAGVIASMIDSRIEDEDNSPEAKAYREARDAFEALSAWLPSHPIVVTDTGEGRS